MTMREIEREPLASIGNAYSELGTTLWIVRTCLAGLAL
jgi:hypothetical protein